MKKVLIITAFFCAFLTNSNAQITFRSDFETYIKNPAVSFPDTINILVSGQSNTGWVLKDTKTKNQVKIPPIAWIWKGYGWDTVSAVTSWNTRGQVWESANFANTHDFQNDQNWGIDTNSNSVGFQFARLLHIKTGKPIRLIITSWSGQPIEKWTGANQTEWSRIVQNVAASGITRIDAFIWCQGESNNGSSFAAYKTQFNILKSNLRAQSWFPASTRILCTEAVRSLTYSKQNEAFRQLSLEDSAVKVVPSVGLWGNGDNIHYSNDNLDKLAERAFNVYLASF